MVQGKLINKIGTFLVTIGFLMMVLFFNYHIKAGNFLTSMTSLHEELNFIQDSLFLFAQPSKEVFF